VVIADPPWSLVRNFITALPCERWTRSPRTSCRPCSSR